MKRSPEKVLSSLAEHSKSEGYKFERIYRILFNEEVYYLAYGHLYANEGNMTKGSDGQTIDGISEFRIRQLIEQLKDESYHPHASKRIYIPKKNGKKRPLGIPAFRDKLLQEVVRMILEAIYEGSFETTSHGFRPGRSCHTALKAIQTYATGTKWFIEGDIKGFFDNIDHDVMIGILKERISDDRFIRLIRKFLKSGYIENWTFRRTYSGTPQGGIISPILANIYLDKLDKYMTIYKKQFNTGRKRKYNPEYRKVETQKKKVCCELEIEKDENRKRELIKKLKEIEKERSKLPCGMTQDENYKRITYQRYADDFLIGIIGSKSEAIKVKEDIKQFLHNNLKLELSEEKTLVTNAKKPAKFLGYNIYVRTSNQSKRNKIGKLIRSYGGRIVLEVTMESIKKKLLEYDAVKMVCHNGKEIWKPTSRSYLKNNDDLEILKQYNSEIRGFYNYYSIANNSSTINSFYYIMEYSMYKTFGTKYRASIGSVIGKFRQGKEFAVKYHNKKGDEKMMLFYNEGFKRKKEVDYYAYSDQIPPRMMYRSSTSLIQRLKANKCELCGSENSKVEIHHVRKLKNLSGKESWEKTMIARRRKTIAVCQDCHRKIHHEK